MTIYSHVASNKRKTIFIMILFVIFFVTVAYIIGQTMGYDLAFVGVILIISSLISFLSYYNSDKIVLALNNAHPATKEEYPELYNVIENLSIATGLPQPKVYIVDDPSPNAFATGSDPKHAAVAATTGLLSILKRSELEGVMAHELSHIKNFDTRLMGVVSILVGSLSILADFFMRSLWWGRGRRSSGGIFMILGIAAAILSPIIATLIQLSISRKREFLADADSALITRYPEGLATALEKIAADPRVLQHAHSATAHFYIENPLKKEGHGNWLSNLFNTHPAVEERVRILRSM